MDEQNVKKSSKGWIIGIVIALIAVAAFMGYSIYQRAKGETPYDYNLSEYVKIGEYKDLPYYTEEVEVTDEEVQQEIDDMIYYATTTEAVLEGKVEEGDTINVAFVGKIDGEEFEGGTSDSYDITVGETSMIEGFVEGLIGKDIGETVTLDLQFPDDYRSEDVAGKPVVFEVTINNKQVSNVPEFNDEFVQENTDFSTVDELKADIERYILESKEQQQDSEIKTAMWNKVLADSEVLKVPEKEEQELIEESEAIEEDYKAQAESYGMEWADFLSMFMGTDEAGFQEMKDEYVSETLKDRLCAYAIARTENVKFTEKDYEARLKELLDNSGYTEETFQADYGMTIKEYAEENGWNFSMFKDALMDKIKSYGKEVSHEEFDEFYADETEVVVEPDDPEEEAEEGVTAGKEPDSEENTDETDSEEGTDETDSEEGTDETDSEGEAEEESNANADTDSEEETDAAE